MPQCGGRPTARASAAASARVTGADALEMASRCDASSAARSSVFFFQAEDGIRDYKVTGVQTCALPIYEELITLNDELQNRNSELEHVNNDLHNVLGNVNIPIIILGSDLRIRRFTGMAEIGRASCRERV